MSLDASPLESTSTIITLADISSTLQVFYTAALVAGVGYSQRMAGRQDFKKEMASKIAAGKITPEQLVDEITIMAEEINNEISESKSFAEAAQFEVEKLLEETRAIQEKLQQIPDALNIEKAALAVEKEKLIARVEVEVEEKVLVTAGGQKEKVTAGGRSEGSAIPIGVVEGFGVYDDVFEIVEEEEEEEKEWSVPVTDDVSTQHDKEKVEAIEQDDADIELVAEVKTPTPMPTPTPSSKHDSTLEIRKKAEDFRARIKQMEARINSETTTQAIPTKVTTEPEPSVSAIVDPTPSADTTSEAKETIKPDPTPAPPTEEPPAEGPPKVKNTPKPQKVIPDGPIKSSPLARLLCMELDVELADVYPGSGLKGRVIADDVRNYAKRR